jgi:hypothetical protein
VWKLEQPVEAVALLGVGWVEVLIPAIADEYLQPIRGQRQPEATPTAADKPQTVEA